MHIYKTALSSLTLFTHIYFKMLVILLLLNCLNQLIVSLNYSGLCFIYAKEGFISLQRLNPKVGATSKSLH